MIPIQINFRITVDISGNTASCNYNMIVRSEFEIYRRTSDLNLVIGPLFGRQDYLYNIHYNVFDFASLRHDLEEAGFSNVSLYDWRETEHAAIDDYSQAYYPHMDKQNGTLVSLNVTAVK